MRILILILCCIVFIPIGAYFAVEKLGMPESVGLAVGFALAYLVYLMRPSNLMR